jgi:WD40 repeat protein/tRNA A-37 threonylcarbamoyl transferase component Bud32
VESAPGAARTPSPPEELFADYLERLESGEQIDFAAFCAAHPSHGEAMAALHAQWAAMHQAFVRLSQPGGPVAAASASVDALKAQLAQTGGRWTRYQVRQEIARGAMGRIVRAWDTELRREVALKILRERVTDSRLQRRFLEEAQIAAQLDHPGIVPVHELGLDAAGRPFFAMQLVRGRDLGELLAAVAGGEPGWTTTRVLGVLLRVCEAMAFAHDRGVVHRDLKPSNIMVGRFGETYVMDWGLARVLGDGALVADDSVDTLRAAIAGEAGSSPLLTQQGEVVGTPAYMAPEQSMRGAAVGPAADIYAVGAILYHLLGGSIPYAVGNRSAEDVLAALRGGPPAPLPHQVPPELRAICERAMARSPADRYPSMSALADDLRAFLEVRTVRAYATGRFAELRKWVARNRRLAALAAALALALVLGTVAVATLWQQADASSTRLQIELDRSTFQRARLQLQLDNAAQTTNELWLAHFGGRMPRATSWALKELAERDPYVVATALPEDGPVVFTPDGDGVLVGRADGRLELRAPQTLAVLSTGGRPGTRITALAVLDEARVLFGRADGEVALVELATGDCRPLGRRHDGEVTALASASPAAAVSAGADGRVLWWPLPDGEARELWRHPTRLNALAVRPGGDGFVAAGDDGTLAGAAFDGSWQLRRRLAESLSSLVFALSRDCLWVGDSSHQLHYLDLAERTGSWTRWTRNGQGSDLVRCNDGSLVVGGWWRSDRWSADGVARSPVALRAATRLALSPDQRWLVTADRDSGLGTVDLRPADRRRVPGAGAAALSGDGRWLATSAGSHATIHDLTTGEAKMLPRGSNGWLALDRQGRRLAVNKMAEGKLHVFDVASGRELFAGDGPTRGSGFAFRFAPDGTELAISLDDRIRRVAADDGALLSEFGWAGVRVVALAWSADGRTLAAAAHGSTAVRLYDVASGACRDEDFAGSWAANLTPSASAVALSPDGRTVALGDFRGPIGVRRSDGTTQWLAGHDGTVWSLQFSCADPGLLFSGGGANGIAAWDLDTGECCFQSVRDQASQLNLSDDGATLACITPAGALALDLGYYERHVAGNLLMRLEPAVAAGSVSAARSRELRAWAAEVLARPWPRWR